jgi:hypothetical protein|tara:strand:- start:118402 stop:118779 length:378 start_codon:yes stop_codon:yes gene_type:complete
MTLNGVDDGGPESVAVRFVCPECDSRIAMITNPMETQMVKSIGVKIGGRDDKLAPMEMIKESIQENARAKDTLLGVKWEESAEKRLLNVPEMARPMARKAIENHAKKMGYETITLEVMDEAKNNL